MDNIALQIILAIGGIIAAGFAIFLIIRLLISFVLTRILSLGCSIASIVMAFSLYSNASAGWDVGEGFTLQWVSALLTFLAWLFCFGPTIFEIEWDGDIIVDINIFGHVDIERSENNLFFILMGFGLPIIAIGYFLLAPEMPLGFFILPAITAVVTVISIFVFGRD